MKNSRLPGEYKVGRSKQVDTRAKDLSRSHPFEIIVLVTYHGLGDQETSIHKSLVQFQVKEGPGTEWFRCDIGLITSLCDKLIASLELHDTALQMTKMEPSLSHGEPSGMIPDENFSLFSDIEY